MVTRRPITNNNWIKNVPTPTTTMTNQEMNNWIKNAPNISGQNFKPWFTKYVNTLKAKGVRIGSKNNSSMFVRSARAKAGLDLYKKFRGFYINAHGFCVYNSKKFTIPKDKAVLFVVESGKGLYNNKGKQLEQTLLRNNGRIQAFIQGSTNILKNKVELADYKGRLFLPGEDIYEHFMHFTRSNTEYVFNSRNNYINNENLRALSGVARPKSFGSSFGRIWKLPLPQGYSSQMEFLFNRDKNKILWNIPAFIKNSTAGKPNPVRFAYRPELQKLSTILRQGPPGVYIVGTCRQDVIATANRNIQNLNNFVFSAMRGGVPKVGANVSSYFNNVKRQNLTNSTRVPVGRTRNTGNLRKLAV